MIRETAMTTPDWSEPKATALLVLADGTVVEGTGIGATGKAAGEVCFNTAMTGYQEILTDPSYAGQIVTFTFPHIGNVGANEEDMETVNAAASSGVARLRASHRHHRSRQLARHARLRSVADGARHRRHHRRRHARADRPHPRERHAERHRRARSRRLRSTSRR